MVLSILAYILFSYEPTQNFVASLRSLSYLGIFLAGLLFSFGFSTPFAVGFFLTTRPENIFLASLIGGTGALMADLFIFKMIRFSFMDEFKKLEKTKPIKEVNYLISNSPLHKIKNYLLYFFAGIIIASPLPDELGVSMLAGLSSIKTHVLGIISFTMNVSGILIMLLLGASYT